MPALPARLVMRATLVPSVLHSCEPPWTPSFAEKYALFRNTVQKNVEAFVLNTLISATWARFVPSYFQGSKSLLFVLPPKYSLPLYSKRPPRLYGTIPLTRDALVPSNLQRPN